MVQIWDSDTISRPEKIPKNGIMKVLYPGIATHLLDYIGYTAIVGT